MSSVVALNGDLASGKTTVGRLLAEHLGVKLVTMGVVQRQIASERGITTLELNRLSEVDPEVDRLIDGRVVEFGESGQSLVMDSRMSWHFIPRAFKVHLIVDRHVAAVRATARQLEGAEHYSSVPEANQKLEARRESERERFIKKYGVDLDRLRNYDAVIDTTSATPSELLAVLLRCLESAGSIETPRIFVDPKRLIPSEPLIRLAGQEGLSGGARSEAELGPASMNEPIREMAREVTVSESIASNGFLDDCPIEVGRSGPDFFILDGHKRVAGAIRAGLRLVPCRLVGENDETVRGDKTADSFYKFVSSESRIRFVYDWQDAFGITFASFADRQQSPM